MCEFRETIEILDLVSGPITAVIAGFALWQLKIGADQIIATKEAARTNAVRDSLRHAADQTIAFADEIIPLWSQFSVLKAEGRYPTLSRVAVEGKRPLWHP
jgi:hypothetical protein